MRGYTLRPQHAEFPLIRVTEGRMCLVGRQSGNTTVLRHESISRRHAALEVRRGTLTVRDQGSMNGTFVNGARVGDAELVDGDTVQFGGVRYAVEEDQSTAEQSIIREFVPSGASFTSSEKQLAMTSLKVRAEDGRPEAARLATLLAIANALSASRTETELFDRILGELEQIISFDRAAVLLFDDAGELQTVLSRPEGGSALATGHASMTIVREALDAGHAVLTADAGDDPRFRGSESVELYHIRSALCLPMATPAGPLGALYFDTKVFPGAWSDGDLEYLGAFAVQAALALSNIQLQRRIRDEAIARARFARFFSPDTVQAILATDPGGDLGGVEREVTVLFSDIRGYTALSETLKPLEVVELLNDYFPLMVDIVFAQDGTLEKYIGDALMAVWGAPISRGDDAQRAVRAALRMQEAVEELNAWWSTQGRPYRIEIGVGINTGIAVTGNIGSEQYLQYATIGDATNTASRLCDAANGGQILLSESTVAKLDGGTVHLGPASPIAVKGRREPVLARAVLPA